MHKITRTFGLVLISFGLLTITACSTQNHSQEFANATDKSAHPALQSENVEKIIQSVNQTVDAANKATDAKQLTARVSGPALTMLQSQYRLHQAKADFKLTNFPAQSEVVTQSRGTSWPKAILNITKADQDQNKYIQVIKQAQAKTPYQLVQWMRILPDLPDRKTVIPNTNVVAQGSSVLPSNQSGNLIVSPEQAAKMWAETALNEKSASAGKVVADAQISQLRQEQKSLQDAIKNSGKLSARIEPLDPAHNLLALELAYQKGALVTATYRYTTELSEVKKDRPIVLSGAVATLLGDQGKVTEKASWTSLINVLLYVPAKNANDPKIQAVGAEQIMIEAKK